LARRVAHGRADGSLHLLPEVESVLRSTSTLFLFMGSEQMWQRLVEGLAGPIRRAGRGAADRIERVHVPTVGSHGLQPLSSQEAVLRVVPDWVDRAISPEARSEASSPATPWAAGTSTGDVGVSARRK
jgi:hypothetical protein